MQLNTRRYERSNHVREYFFSRVIPKLALVRDLFTKKLVVLTTLVHKKIGVFVERIML